MTQIEVRKFDELTTRELHDILKLRNEVFVVEQECSYLDIDGNDCVSTHIFMKEDENIVACCRVLPEGVTFPEVAIGRVVTGISYRHKGYARALMQRAIEYAIETMHVNVIMLSAQVYLTEFYKSLGFYVVSEIYLEDNIPHNDMRYTKT